MLPDEACAKTSHIYNYKINAHLQFIKAIYVGT